MFDKKTNEIYKNKLQELTAPGAATDHVKVVISQVQICPIYIKSGNMVKKSEKNRSVLTPHPLLFVYLGT